MSTESDTTENIVMFSRLGHFAADETISKVSRYMEENRNTIDLKSNAAVDYDVNEDLELYNRFDILPVDETMLESDEDIREESDIRDDFMCPICLELFFRPHLVRSCGHVFCEHCLRQLCKATPKMTKCPMCRELIYKCVFDPDLTEKIKVKFENRYRERRLDARQMRKDDNPLPGCTDVEYNRYLKRKQQQAFHSQRRTTEQSNSLRSYFGWFLILFLVYKIWFWLDNQTEYEYNIGLIIGSFKCKLLLCEAVRYCVQRVNKPIPKQMLYIFIFFVALESLNCKGLQIAANIFILFLYSK
ncbi:E3 ubiquitin-protein ligase RNF180-like [Mercenaria mercenaria]|uniref:E3 ubiquitin-protein ligase RNF180-like n=1 Tax=Mercenaria mercenaria TaxID=6596 RepID=UPI00234F9783|nr:E3 ubiquitin-protein ligase RNF180-like [Mercenaria mercenaria]